MEEQNNPHIKWIAVSSDALINEAEKSQYEVYHRPYDIRYSMRQISSINVADFMVRLLKDEDL